MIYDTLDELEKYAGLAPTAWPKIMDFIRNFPHDAALGRHEIDGSRIYVLVQRYQPHAADYDRLEIHQKYIDIQVLLAGRETIYFDRVNDLAVTTAFNPEKDVEFFRGTPARVMPLHLEGGRFAVFFPEEGHIPGCGDPAGEEVLKLVVKIDRAVLGA